MTINLKEEDGQERTGRGTSDIDNPPHSHLAGTERSCRISLQRHHCTSVGAVSPLSGSGYAHIR
jgi:hypothetical protein